MSQNHRLPNKTFTIEGQPFVCPCLDPGLYVVATPLGNLGDITIRALQTLAGAEIICCEDTRISLKLLSHYGIKPARLNSYYRGNEARRGEWILGHLQLGKSVALISDAGTPVISDPGQRLISRAASAGHRIIPIPGACSVIAALSCAGLVTDEFYFFGYLPVKTKHRKALLQWINELTATTVLFTPVRDLLTTLAQMAEFIEPERQIVIGRELTKVFEQVKRGTIGEMLEFYANNLDLLRGEIVILLEGRLDSKPAPASNIARLDLLLAAGLQRYSLRLTVDKVSKLTGIGRKTVYSRALEIARILDANAPVI